MGKYNIFPIVLLFGKNYDTHIDIELVESRDITGLKVKGALF